MADYLISLKPEAKLFNKIKFIKKRINSVVGNQKYLLDEPHITLYLGNYSNDIKIIEKTDRAVNIIRKKRINTLIDVGNWKIYPKDPVTKKTTVVCELNKLYENLRLMQILIIKEIYAHRDKNIARYNSMTDLKEPMKTNLTRYGFPFVGEIWEAHIGIASFDAESFSLVWPDLLGKSPRGISRIQSLCIFRLDEEENLTLIKEYIL